MATLICPIATDDSIEPKIITAKRTTLINEKKKEPINHTTNYDTY